MQYESDNGNLKKKALSWNHFCNWKLNEFSFWPLAMARHHDKGTKHYSTDREAQVVDWWYCNEIPSIGQRGQIFIKQGQVVSTKIQA